MIIGLIIVVLIIQADLLIMAFIFQYYTIDNNNITVYNKFKNIIFEGSLSNKNHTITRYFYHNNKISKESIIFCDIDKQINFSR